MALRETAGVRGVSRPWSFLTKRRRQVRKQCAATTLIDFVSFSRGAASPSWNASSPRSAFPLRATNRGKERERDTDIRPWNIERNQWSKKFFKFQVFPPSTLEQLTYSLIHFVIKFETKIRSSEMHREIRRSIRIGDRQSRSSYVAKIFVDEKLRSKRNGRSKEFAFTRSSCITDRRADDRSAWFFCLQIARSSFYSWQRGNERDRPRGAPRI